MSRNTQFPRALRLAPTEAETLLWRKLRGHQLGVHFRRQHPVGCYVADFACTALKLIIELDGGQHMDGADTARDRDLAEAGWRVLRFWNHEVLANLNGVVEAIQAAAGPPPNPPPPAGEG